MNNQYSSVVAASEINIQRSKFKLSQQIKTTFNTGKLIPTYLQEVLPGDTFKVNVSAVIRMSTPIKPVMDNAWADVTFYFVPYRLLWEHWEELNGANNSGPWAQQTEYTVPQTTAPSGGWTKGTIADYMGLPTKVANISVSSLPFRAYCKIWNDWYRDENLQNFTYIDTGDSNTTGTNGTNYVTSPITGGMPLNVAKPHDYFTSALPEPQKGPDVLLPLGDTAPVMGNGMTLGLTDGTNLTGLFNNNGDNVTVKSATYGLNVGSTSSTSGLRETKTLGITTDPTKSGIIADLSSATAATVNELRLAFQLQKLYERDARGGTRYIEILRSHFGVISDDARLQRAEYLGGKRVPITITQVPQTSATNDTSPQGNTAAFSLTGDYSEYFTKSFKEHGIIIGMVDVRTEHTYQQGIERFWSRKTRTDFYLPVLANIGEQAILNKEIFAQGTSADNEAFGYQEAWADYRKRQNKVTGEFRSNVAENGGLDIWHYADYYDELPTLGSDWIQETAVNVDRTLAVQSSVSDQFLADLLFDVTAVRPMPVFSIPGRIDHN